MQSRGCLNQDSQDFWMTMILFKSFNRGNLVNQANPGSDHIIAGGKTQHHAPKMSK
jgi:hypothetical protein